MNVLLVDDDPEIRLLASYVLRGAGHNVEEAEDGAAAATILRHARIDVLLMDLMLEREDGVEVAARLLQDIAPRPRLVFLTGAVRSEQHARMRAAGADGILEKPFDPVTLPARLHELTGGAA